MSIATGPGATAILRETGAVSHSLLAFFCLSNLDVVVARATFDEHEAGLYAAGLILTKAVLFLPQFVVVLAFPTMAAKGGSRRSYLAPLLLVALIGVSVTAGVAWLDGLAVTFVGGEQYAELRPFIWLFALLGTVLAMTQLMVYALVARQRRGATLVTWAGTVVVLVVALLADDSRGLVTGVASADVVLLLVLLAAAQRHRASPVAAPVVDPA